MNRIIVETPDYQAALQEYLWIAWAKDGLGPYAEELADKVLPNGVTVPVISNFEEAKRIVDAALAGRELSEFSPEATEAAARVWCERNGFVYYPPQWGLGRKGLNYENAEAALAAALEAERNL